MIQEFLGSNTGVTVSNTTAVSSIFLAMSLMPAALYPMPQDTPGFSINYQTPGQPGVRLRSEMNAEPDIAHTLQRLVNYFLEDEPAVSADIALASRKHFREMYVRF